MRLALVMLLAASASATINPHPRLWVDSPHLTSMRAKVTANAPEWVTFSGWLDPFVASWNSNPSAISDTNIGLYVHNFALMYQILKGMSDSGGSCLSRACTDYGVTHSATAYADTAALFLNQKIAHADASCLSDWGQVCDVAHPFISSASAGNEGFKLSLTFDWVYSFLSPSDISAFVTQMRYGTVYEYNRYPSYWIDPMNNGTNRIWNFIQMVGYATFGDNPSDSGQTNAEITESWAYYNTYMKPFWNTTGLGGATPDGSEYSWDNPRAWGQFILAARTAESVELLTTGEIPNFANDLSDGVINVLTAPTFTGTYSIFDWGDEEHPFTWSDATIESGLWLADLSTGNHQKYIRYWVDHAGKVSFGSTGFEWEVLMFHSTGWAATDYRAVPISTSYYGSGIGINSWRSDWTANATWMTFAGGFGNTNHAHSSTGNFTVNRNGQWLAQDFPGYQLCFSDSAVHNVMMFKGPNDTIWKGSVALQAVSDPYIDRQESVEGRYSYARSIETGAYRSVVTNIIWTNATYVDREVIYLNPDYSVILDRATFNDAGTKTRFNVTSPVAPSVSGNVATFTNGGQSLFVSSLSPATTINTLDFSTVSNWYWNGDPTTCTSAYAGGWYQQAQVETNSGGTSQVMLNAMQTANSGTTPLTMTKITNGSVLAAHIPDATANWVVAFNSSAPAASFSLPISYTYTPTTTTRKHLIANLPVGTGVSVTDTSSNGVSGTVTISAGSAMTVSTAGVLAFSNTGGVLTQILNAAGGGVTIGGKVLRGGAGR